ncbi:MAG: hypothetical protein ACM3PY_06440 [Omnitrophica WOR_2 bacterium]
MNSRAGNQEFSAMFTKFRFQRGLVFGALIVTALFAFEIFNFSTTDYALGDLLGNLTFAGVKWATILAIAFCGIDFAGIARLFTPQDGAQEPNEVWYLFGAWMLAATMNAMLTWWGVSLAIVEHQTLGSAIIARQTLLRIVPIFVAVMVWLIRVLIIGTFSLAGERLFSQTGARASRPSSFNRPAAAFTTGINRPVRESLNTPRPVNTPSVVPSFRPAPKNTSAADQPVTRPEPSYHPVAMRPNSNGDKQSFN